MLLTLRLKFRILVALSLYETFLYWVKLNVVLVPKICNLHCAATFWT